jgi:hypothetical protein
MLTLDDLAFLVQALDKTQIQGIQSSMKMNEVFLKLSQMKKVLEDGSKEEAAVEEEVSE